MWLPCGVTWLAPCARAAVASLARGVGDVLAAAGAGRLHVAPSLMEEVQDAIGTMYYLLTNHGR